MPPKKSSAAKKKKNLGSARGFATVSVPKRVDPVADEPTVDGSENDSATPPGGNAGGPDGVNGAKGGADGAGNKAAAAADGPNGTGAAAPGAAGNAKSGDWDDSPEALERKELQELAERIKPGCDKEISRVVKVRLFLLWLGTFFSLGRGILADPRALITIDQVYEYERRMSKTLPSFAWHERDVVSWSETLSRGTNEC